MAEIETQAEADALNASGTFGPYAAANGHRMVAPLRFPIDTAAWEAEAGVLMDAGKPVPPRTNFEREFRVGDTIRYDSFAAECAPGCDHRESGPPEDW